MKSRHTPRLLALALLQVLAVVLSGCPHSTQSTAATAKDPIELTQPAMAASVGAKSDAGKDKLPETKFDEKLAWASLHQQVSYGFRVPGTKGHQACKKYLIAELLRNCDKVEQQEFSVTVRGQKLGMTNLIGRFGLDQQRRVILAAHWDTRPTAEQNPDGQRNLPITGANDGASGVAILVELARVFHDSPPPVGVDIVFFDGEDYGPGLDMMFLGAKHFAKQLSVSQVRAYNYGILLDMVGDRDLDIHPESNSELNCPQIYQVAQSVNQALGLRTFKSTGMYEIYDDHLSLQERGVRMYDFIDFNYEYWHTTDDTEDKCSTESLGAVGRTLEVMVRRFPEIYK